jgi:hypothetical protein
MYNRTLLIGRIGHDAEAKTDKNQQESRVESSHFGHLRSSADAGKTSRATEGR